MQAPAATQPEKGGRIQAQDLLIRGTVFNEKALAFPGVKVQIRQAGEKKFRWVSYTNSRGEFAVRVLQNTDYEIVVHSKGYLEQKRALNAKDGDNYESMAFRMEPVKGDKK